MKTIDGIEYVIVDIPNKTTFSRVRQKDGQIEVNKGMVEYLTENELRALVLWCDVAFKLNMFSEAEIETDKKVFEVCKEKGIERDFLTALMKQSIQSQTYNSIIRDRIDQLEKLYRKS